MKFRGVLAHGRIMEIANFDNMEIDNLKEKIWKSPISVKDWGNCQQQRKNYGIRTLYLKVKLWKSPISVKDWGNCQQQRKNYGIRTLLKGKIMEITNFSQRLGKLPTTKEKLWNSNAALAHYLLILPSCEHFT